MDEINSNKSRSLLDVCIDMQDKLKRVIEYSDNGLSPLIFPNETISKILNLVQDIKKVNTSSTPKITLVYVDRICDVILKLADLANNNFYNNGLRLFQHNLQIAIKNSSDFPKHKLTISECTWLELTNSTLIITMSLSFAPNFLERDDLPLSCLGSNNLGAITDESSQYVKDFKESLLELIKFADVLRNSYFFINLLNSLYINVQEYRIEKSGVIDNTRRKVVNLVLKHEITNNQEKQNSCAELIEIVRNKLKNQTDQSHGELIDDFEIVFRNNLKREYKFENSVHIIDKLLSYFATFFPKPDTSKEIIRLYSQIVSHFSSTLAAFYKLPRTIVNPAEVLSLTSETHMLEASLLNLKSSGEFPDKWTQEKCTDFETNIRAFIRIGTVLFNASTLVLEANQIIGKTEIYLDIHDLMPIKIGKEFTQISYPPDQEEIIAQNSNLISSISFGEILNVRNLKNVSPANFITLFAKIFNMIDELSRAIFRFWIDLKLNGQQVSKTILSDLHDKIALLVLNPDKIPLEIVSTSKLFYILFELGFNLDNIKLISTMLQDISKIYSVYAFFNDLEILGLANVTVCSHLSFIVTILSQYGQNNLADLRDFVSSLNILHVDFQSLADRMAESTQYIGQIYGIFSTPHQSKNILALKEVSKYISNNFQKSENISKQILPILEMICNRTSSLNCKTIQVTELLDITVDIVYIVKYFQRQNCDLELINSLIRMKGLLDKLMQVVRQKPMLLTFIRFMQGYSTKNILNIENENMTDKNNRKYSRVNDIDKYIDKESEHYKNFFEKSHGSDAIQYEKNDEEKDETEDLKVDEISNLKKDENVIRLERKPLEIFGNLNGQYYFEFCKEEWNFPGIIDLFNQCEKNFTENESNHMITVLAKDICVRIRDYVRLLNQQLTEYNRRAHNNHQHTEIVIQEKDLTKALSAMDPIIDTDNYSWVETLIEISIITYAIYDILEFTHTQLSPILAFRSLAIRCYSLIILQSTLEIHPFDLDLKLIGSLVIFILLQRQFLTDKNDQTLNSLRHVCESPTSYFSDFIVISDSRRIFDVYEIVKVCVSFENRNKFALQNIKTNHQKLSGLLDDEEFCEIMAQKSLVFRFVLSNFSKDYVGEEIIIISAIKENIAEVRNVCQALLCLENLVDIAKNIGILSPLMIENTSNGVKSLPITALSFVLFEIRYWISKLFELKTTETVSLEYAITSFMTFFERYLQSFATISIEDVKELPQKFNSFVKVFNDFDLTSIVDNFSKNFMFLMAFIEEMNYNDENNDFKCLFFLANNVRTIPSRIVCQKMIYALNFVRVKINEQNFTSLTEKLIIDLKSISLVFEIYDLLMHANSKIRNIVNAAVDFPIINLKKAPEIDELNMKSDKLENELSLFDQTALITMTSSLFDANLAMKEKLLELGKLEKQNMEKDEEIKRLEKEIEALEESKQILQTQEQKFEDIIQENHEEKEVIKIGNYEKPKYIDESIKIHSKLLNGLENRAKTRMRLQVDLEFIDSKNEKAENNELPKKYQSKANSIAESLQNWQNMK